MSEAQSPHIQELAETALKQAEEHCRALEFDPSPHIALLTDLIIQEISLAAEEMANDRIAGGPAMAYALSQPFWRQIYWHDASERAAKALVSRMASSSSTPPPSSSSVS